MRNAYILLESNPTDRVLYDLLKERQRHAEIGYTTEHDDGHMIGDLLAVALDYVTLESEPACVYYSVSREELIKSISVMVAAVELMDRKQ